MEAAGQFSGECWKIFFGDHPAYAKVNSDKIRIAKEWIQKRIIRPQGGALPGATGKEKK